MIEESFALAIESVKLFSQAISEVITDFKNLSTMLGSETGFNETIEYFEAIRAMAGDARENWVEMLKEKNPLSESINKFLDENKLKISWVPRQDDQQTEIDDDKWIEI